MKKLGFSMRKRIPKTNIYYGKHSFEEAKLKKQHNLSKGKAIKHIKYHQKTFPKYSLGLVYNVKITCQMMSIGLFEYICIYTVFGILIKGEYGD